MYTDTCYFNVVGTRWLVNYMVERYFCQSIETLSSDTLVVVNYMVEETLSSEIFLNVWIVV